ncbi:membrane protein [Desulfosarcina ovata subsp. sediminis]|uniref:Membrane protein n=1 Tax=Desulfosarcina ovata subsp. sediminis TaxID=885957 RepID=A0A5K7ZRQ9_9BACT|nr:DUF3999 domain-containing protein [Desulfosarcina ovata]BBO82483.1 membrane protein [Desulfosarcina ovata subsp. sediminis]
MRRWLWLALLLAWPALAGAAGLSPSDFAYGIRITVPVGTPVAALSLPKTVYEHTSRTDLGDLRVFNQAGEVVPHLIRFASSREAESSWQPLPFFPLPKTPATVAGGYGVEVHTGADGTVVRIDPQDSGTGPGVPRAFLIDLNRTGRNLAGLRLTWKPDGANRMSLLAVDAGDDLVHWTTVQPRWAVSDIQYGSHRLLNNTIPLKSSQRRYLRLRQLDEGPALALTAVEGRKPPEGRQPVRAYLKIKGTPVMGTPGEFLYQAGGAFPVDRVNLIFSQANSMAEATLWSRADPDDDWTRRFKGLFYRIDRDGTVLSSEPKTVAISTDRYWRLMVDDSESTIGNAVPELSMGYRPHDLYFVARGNGPYTLAFGNTLAQPLTVDVAALFDGIGRQPGQGIERWVEPRGRSFVLGGPQRLKPQPKPLPTRRIVLWSILLAGVLVVAGMAWRLARRLKG